MTAAAETRVAARAIPARHGGARIHPTHQVIVHVASPLHNELVAMLDQDQIPPCAFDPDGLHLSENAKDRARAVVLCAGCPLMTSCAAEAERIGERFGVWGGVDRTGTVRSLTRGDAA